MFQMPHLQGDVMSPLAPLTARSSAAISDRPYRLLALALVLLVAAFAAAPIRAAAPENSLSLVPADAGLYMTFLRNKEQFDRVANSRWFARLKEMPAFQKAWEQIESSWNEDDGPGEKLEGFLADPDNRELAELGLRLTYDEVFLYADDSLADIYDVYQDAGWAGNFAMYGALASGDFLTTNSNSLMVNAWFDVLDKQKDRIRVPKVVVGLKIRDEDLPIAKKQMERLTAARELLGVLRPDLKERLKKIDIEGSTFWTLELEGTDYDWSELPEPNLEDLTKYKAVIEKIKSMKAAVSVGVHQGYLMFSLGPTNEHLGALGKGMLLVNRPEFAPLRKLDDQEAKFTQVYFMSAKYHGLNSYLNPDDLETLARHGKDLVNKAPLDLAEKRKIQGDIDELVADARPHLPRFGPVLSFNFLTDRGLEGFGYDWSTYPDAAENEKLDVLSHVGGSPLFVAAAPGGAKLENYELTVKWLRKIHGYAEQFLVPQLPLEAKARYVDLSERLLPLFSRFDKTTREKWIPALGDAQTAFVIDASLEDKLWLESLPPAEQDLKLIQPALVMTTRDGKQAAAAIDDYRKIVNEMVVEFQVVNPDASINFRIPDPQVRDEAEGKLYVFPLPDEAGASKRLRPNYGASEKVLAFSIAPEHTAALLKSTPLALDAMPAPKQLVGFVHTDLAGLTDAVVPWIKLTDEISGNEPTDEQREDAAALFDLMHGLRSIDVAAWREKGVLIMHSEFHIRDLPE